MNAGITRSSRLTGSDRLHAVHTHQRRETTFGVLNLSHSQSSFFNLHYQRVFELMGLLVGQMLTLIHISSVFQRRNLD